MRITMDDLARMSGYSKATISRALNDDPRVKEETKREIKRLARKFRYHPHTVASNLARQQSRIVGLVFPQSPRSISDPFFLEFIKGVTETLAMAGFSILVPPMEREGFGSVLERLIYQHRVDGVILTEPKVADDRIDFLQENEVPFVFLGSTLEEGVLWVDGDNVRGAYLATRHLLGLGHRRIAILLGEEQLVSAGKRYQGYRQALLEAGIEPQEELAIKGDFTFEAGYQLVKDMLAEGIFPDCTAVFASNDLMAIGAMRAFREAGKRVPEDYSLVGFDGIELTRYVDPRLTTIQQPIHLLGREVSKKLLTYLEDNHVEEEQTLIPLELTEGSTTMKLSDKERR
ncbi:MAG: LacI family DNA-binding transcriptional regulator [Halanaerobium sp.]|nr:LacI family DNA-binding transcriptional regulator [Halanaerobium sp.]